MSWLFGLSKSGSTFQGTGVPEPVHCTSFNELAKSQRVPPRAWSTHISVVANVADQSFMASGKSDGWVLDPIPYRVNERATSENATTVPLVLPKSSILYAVSPFPLDNKIYDVMEVWEKEPDDKPLLRVFGGSHNDSSSSYFALVEPDPTRYRSGRRPDGLCITGIPETDYRPIFPYPDQTVPGAISQSMAGQQHVTSPEFRAFPDAGSYLLDSLGPIDQGWKKHKEAATLLAQAASSKPNPASKLATTGPSTSGGYKQLEKSLLD